MKLYGTAKWCVLESLVLLSFLIVGLVGCAPQSVADNDSKLDVTVSIVPQRYFVERIGGEYVSVSVMVEPGASPATYEPKPEQLKDLSKSVAYFSIGVPFENVWLGKIVEANKAMLLVDTIAQVERMPMATHHHEGEDEQEEEHEDEVGAPDPHVWVSPELVKLQSQAIYEALSQLDPQHQDAYKANLITFIEDIDALESDIRETLSGLKNNKFMVFHPAWGYFARDFGLEQIPVEVGGQEPSAQELAVLIEHAQEEGIQVVFAQPEFSIQNAETIAKEIGGEVLLISPLAPDWLDNMHKVAQTFADALNKE
ncbi:MAG: zinc ABC transporter substrate-binding protein [Anaerolineae bacterium]|nr:zinc ABC transporter substrate-binding protein [Anaerolineae bacterium]